MRIRIVAAATLLLVLCGVAVAWTQLPQGQVPRPPTLMPTSGAKRRPVRTWSFWGMKSSLRWIIRVEPAERHPMQDIHVGAGADSVRRRPPRRHPGRRKRNPGAGARHAGRPCLGRAGAGGRQQPRNRPGTNRSSSRPRKLGFGRQERKNGSRRHRRTCRPWSRDSKTERR